MSHRAHTSGGMVREYLGANGSCKSLANRITLDRRILANALIDSSEHSSGSFEAKFFGIEFADLHVSKEHSLEARSDQLDSQLFEGKYLTEEDSFLVPANVAAIVDSSQLKFL